MQLITEKEEMKFAGTGLSLTHKELSTHISIRGFVAVVRVLGDKSIMYNLLGFLSTLCIPVIALVGIHQFPYLHQHLLLKLHVNQMWLSAVRPAVRTHRPLWGFKSTCWNTWTALCYEEVTLYIPFHRFRAIETGNHVGWESCVQIKDLQGHPINWEESTVSEQSYPQHMSNMHACKCCCLPVAIALNVCKLLAGPELTGSWFLSSLAIVCHIPKPRLQMWRNRALSTEQHMLQSPHVHKGEGG